MKAYVHLRYLAEFFLEWEMFKDKSCTENQNTHFIFSNFFPNVVAFMTWYMIWEREREKALQPDNPLVIQQDVAEKIRFPCQITKAKIWALTHND